MANKRLSNWGGEVRGAVEVLEKISLPLVSAANDPGAQEKIEILIDHGRQFEAMFRGIIHKELRAPPVYAQAELHQQFAEWQQAAYGIAESHTKLLAQYDQSHDT